MALDILYLNILLAIPLSEKETRDEHTGKKEKLTETILQILALKHSLTIFFNVKRTFCNFFL